MKDGDASVIDDWAGILGRTVQGTRQTGVA